MSNGISPAASFLLTYAESLLSGKTFLVLTGAGISTNAGLPDYRGQGQSRRASPEFDRFRSNLDVRREYWVRALAGWAKLAAARPTNAHLTLAQLQHSGRCQGIVTQNVDGLHSAAGSSDVIELHGNDQQVRCIECNQHLDRQEFEKLFREMNPGLERLNLADVSVPSCSCGGTWRPSNTMFGEEVNKDMYRKARLLLERSEGFLVLGSSLRVTSGYQLLQSAVSMSIPSILINLGASQGVGVADVSIFVDCDSGVGQIFRGSDYV